MEYYKKFTPAKHISLKPIYYYISNPAPRDDDGLLQEYT